MKTMPISTSSMDPAACYAAFQAHDARFDGRVFVAVSSTGIYCRPVCRVRMPRVANCSFHVSAASAEAAGYRPCRKCRPELAPGLAPVDATHRLARQAVLMLENGCLAEQNVAELAAALDVSDRHLRRVFAAAFGVSPVQYLQTRRLLLAKSLLADTGLSITEIAFAAGFGSLRRFNALVKSRYRLPPSALRSRRRDDAADADRIVVLLGYRPPYAWREMLAFLTDRVVPGVESVTAGVYRRTVRIAHGGAVHAGWLAVENMAGKNALAVTLAPSLLPVLPLVLAKVRHFFDLDCDPEAIHEKLADLETVREGIRIPGLRVPGCFDAFEMAVRAILGQQITVKAARTLAARMALHFGAEIATPFPELTRAFPSPETIAELSGEPESHLGPLGIIRTRARSIRALAEALLRDGLRLSPAADPDPQMEALLALPGFGQWTAQYVAMRALAWPDAFPHTDLGVKKALAGRSDREILAMAEAWRPWRSYATMNLWHSLSTGSRV